MPETKKVLRTAVHRAIAHCDGSIMLCMAGSEVENRRRKNIARMLMREFQVRSYTTYALVEAECPEDDVPITFPQLQQECVRLLLIRARTNARFDFVGDIIQLPQVERALVRAVRHVSKGAQTRVPRGVFRYVFPQPMYGVGVYPF